MRDSQRAKVYSAQRLVDSPAMDSLVIDPVHYCRDVLARHQRMATGLFFDPVGVDVRINRRMRGRWAGRAWPGRRIDFADWHPTVRTALHECAHVLTNHTHDRDFCRVYLALVKAELGDEAYRELRRCFAARRVKYTRKRQYSRATMLAMKERGRKLAASRFGVVTA